MVATPEDPDAMTSTVPKTEPPAAPPGDPVKDALEDPDTRARMVRHANALLRNLADAEEVVDEALMRLWKKKDEYDPAVGSVGNWLSRYVTNTIRERFRDRTRRAGSPLVEHCEARIDHEPDLADIRFQVERYLNKLAGEYKAAVKLRYLEDLEYAEIAVRLNTTPVNARAKVSRGLQQLREYAKKEGRP